ncbi:MAG TPA: hypothetical protein VFF01_03850 [Candidatus Deferrimicrobiaceae bacterium]|nr:hypothetical protein [Candidatus Deferrimicrobiaceae bacterium]
MSYSNPGFAMLGYAVTAALKKAADKDIRSLVDNRIMTPIGVPGSEWDCGYGMTFVVDRLPLVPIWGGGKFSPNAAARVGRRLLRRGDWDGNQLLSPAVVQAGTTRSNSGLPGYGLFGWWGNVDDNGNRISSSLPRDAFYAMGSGHQIVLVVPSIDLILVRFGDFLDGQAFDISPTSNFMSAFETFLFKPLMASVVAPQ